MATVKCYRALTALKIGPEDTRAFGDLVPEAADWPNPEVYIRAGQLEVVWVDEAEVKKFLWKGRTTASSTPTKKIAVKKKTTVTEKKPVRKITRTKAKEVVNHGIIEEAV